MSDHVGDDPTPRAGSGAPRRSATQLAADPAFTATYASVVGLTGTGIDTTGATDSAAALNALLAANPGKTLRGIPGAYYLISAPLVIKSGTTLDLSGCTITLVDGNAVNMLNNAAVTATATGADAAVSSGSNVVTTALGAQAVVGQSIVVAGAGGNSSSPYTGLVSAKTSTTITVTDLDGTALNAGTTVASAAISLYTRDTNIRVVGGSWVRQVNSGGNSAVAANSIRFRHVDGLVVERVTYTSAKGKYGINVGDCTDVQVLSPRFISTYSDGVHVNGPVRRVIVRDVIGDVMGDDLVSFTAYDPVTTMMDVAGDIADCLVDGSFLRKATTTAGPLKITSGPTYTVRNITARKLVGDTTYQSLAYIGDTSGGTIDNILVEDVTSCAGTGVNYGVLLQCNGTMDRITLRRINTNATEKLPVFIGQNVTVKRLVIEGSQNTSNTTGTAMVQVAGNVDRLVVRDCQYTPTAGFTTALVTVLSGQTPAASLSKLQIANCTYETSYASAGATVLAQNGTTCGEVQISNMRGIGIRYPLGQYGTTTTVEGVNVKGSSMTGWIYATSTGVVTLQAHNCDGDNDTVTIDASGSLRSKAFGLRCDIGTTGIAKNAGDMAYNTNAARSCGVGPVVSDGTNWKGLFSGATF